MHMTTVAKSKTSISLYHKAFCIAETSVMAQQCDLDYLFLDNLLLDYSLPISAVNRICQWPIVFRVGAC